MKGKFMSPTSIIDAHHHLWCPENYDPDLGYVWLRKIGEPKPFGDPTSIQRNYLLEEFLAEATPNKIEASVHIQADNKIPDPVAETKFIERHAQEHAHPISIVARVDLSQPDARAQIEAHRAASDRFVGIRQILSRLPHRPDLSFTSTEYISVPAWREGFAMMADYGLGFDLLCYPEQIAPLAEFFTRHPDVPVIINHSGSPWDQTKDGLVRWRNALDLLAELPHVMIKVSGFGMYDPDWTAESIRPIFEGIEEAFGRDRMMFASNYPVDKIARTYQHTLDATSLMTSGWNSKDKVAFFSETARKIYRPL